MINVNVNLEAVNLIVVSSSLYEMMNLEEVDLRVVALPKEDKNELSFIL